MPSAVIIDNQISATKTAQIFLGQIDAFVFQRQEDNMHAFTLTMTINLNYLLRKQLIMEYAQYE